MSKKNIGSSFENFLKEDGIYQEVTSHAVKCVIAWQLAEAMKARKISRSEMAKRMKTSRTQITRLFDPDNDRVQLDTIQKAAAVVGKRISITLEDVKT
jgi:antitoxin HicB